jgi:hypothetical protein
MCGIKLFRGKNRARPRNCFPVGPRVIRRWQKNLCCDGRPASSEWRLPTFPSYLLPPSSLLPPASSLLPPSSSPLFFPPSLPFCSPVSFLSSLISLAYLHNVSPHSFLTSLVSFPPRSSSSTSLRLPSMPSTFPSSTLLPPSRSSPYPTRFGSWTLNQAPE